MVRFLCLPYYPLRVTSPFGPREISVPGATKMHWGVDLGRNKASADIPYIRTVSHGTVKASYYNKSRGWVVVVDHGGFFTLYQHLAGRGAVQGRSVAAGDIIGVMGNTGVSGGIHLHLELIVSGKRIDPLPYLLDVIERGNKKMEIYDRVADLPAWFRPSIEKVVALGGLKGDGNGNLGLTPEMCRIYVSLDNMGLLDAVRAVRKG